jgi:large repetitive protein
LRRHLTQDITLSNDVTNCSGDGLDIGADGITIHLNGHNITAAGPAYASGINFHDHVTVIAGAVLRSAASATATSPAG